MKSIKTKRGYDLLDVASALQKSVRRGDTRLAGYFAHELFASGFIYYVWKRLLTISAEDCHGLITQEIKALHESFEVINKGAKKPKGRIFVSKAVIILAGALKSRDADHLQCLLYDKNIGIEDEEIDQEINNLNETEYVDLPDYTFDCHTKTGKLKGMTKKEFFKDEQAGLHPKQMGLFDELPDAL